MRKRLLAELLALCMVLALLPAPAWANDTTPGAGTGTDATDTDATGTDATDTGGLDNQDPTTPTEPATQDKPEKSSDATLKSLTVGGQDVVLTADKTSYDVKVSAYARLQRAPR